MNCLILFYVPSLNSFEVFVARKPAELFLFLRRSVIVVDPPFPHTNKWVQITALPLTSEQLPSFVGVLTEVDGAGVYNCSAAIIVPTGSAVCSISFETANAQEFMHIDFTTNNTVRIDDIVEFGSFVRDQVFLLQVTLNITTAQSTAHVTVSGGGAAGDRDYTMPPPFHILSLQFGAIRLWKGFGDPGSFDATNIVVSREP